MAGNTADLPLEGEAIVPSLVEEFLAWFRATQVIPDPEPVDPATGSSVALTYARLLEYENTANAADDARDQMQLLRVLYRLSLVPEARGLLLYHTCSDKFPAIMHLLTGLETGTRIENRTLICGIFANCALNPELATWMVRLDVFEAILPSLKLAVNILLKSEIARCFANLAGPPDARRALVGRGIVRHVKTMIQESEPEYVRLNAVGCMANLCIDSDIAKDMGTLDNYQSCASLLSAKDHEVVSEALRCLGNMIVTDEQRDVILATGIVGDVVSLLTSSEPDIQAGAASVVCSLSASPNKAAELCSAHSSTVRCLISLVRSGPMYTQEMATRALRNISASADAAQSIIAVDFSPLIHMIHRAQNAVLNNVLVAIRNLSAMGPDVRLTIGVERGVEDLCIFLKDIIEEGMEDHRLEPTLHILYQMANDENHRNDIIALGMAPSLGVFSRSTKKPKIQMLALSLVRKLATGGKSDPDNNVNVLLKKIQRKKRSLGPPFVWIESHIQEKFQQGTEVSTVKFSDANPTSQHSRPLVYTPELSAVILIQRWYRRRKMEREMLPDRVLNSVRTDMQMIMSAVGSHTDVGEGSGLYDFLRKEKIRLWREANNAGMSWLLLKDSEPQSARSMASANAASGDEVTPRVAPSSKPELPSTTAQVAQLRTITARALIAKQTFIAVKKKEKEVLRAVIRMQRWFRKRQLVARIHDMYDRDIRDSVFGDIVFGKFWRDISIEMWSTVLVDDVVWSCHREEELSRENASLDIQRVYRSYKTRKGRKDGAAVKVQSHFRGWQIRKVMKSPFKSHQISTGQTSFASFGQSSMIDRGQEMTSELDSDSSVATQDMLDPNDFESEDEDDGLPPPKDDLERLFLAGEREAASLAKIAEKEKEEAELEKTRPAAYIRKPSKGNAETMHSVLQPPEESEEDSQFTEMLEKRDRALMKELSTMISRAAHEEDLKKRVLNQQLAEATWTRAMVANKRGETVPHDSRTVEDIEEGGFSVHSVRIPLIHGHAAGSAFNALRAQQYFVTPKSASPTKVGARAREIHKTLTEEGGENQGDVMVAHRKSVKEIHMEDALVTLQATKSPTRTLTAMPTATHSKQILEKVEHRKNKLRDIRRTIKAGRSDQAVADALRAPRHSSTANVLPPVISRARMSITDSVLDVLLADLAPEKLEELRKEEEDKAKAKALDNQENGPPKVYTFDNISEDQESNRDETVESPGSQVHSPLLPKWLLNRDEKPKPPNVKEYKVPELPSPPQRSVAVSDADSVHLKKVWTDKVKAQAKVIT